MNPLVSVIITTYNRNNLLCRAIDSVLGQGYPRIEIIVVDDCSMVEAAHEIGSLYAGRVKFVRHKKNRGLAAARNTGIDVSSGELISFLDDDDEILPDKIEKQVAFFKENPRSHAVFCGAIQMYEGGRKVVHIPENSGQLFPEVLHGTPNAIHTLMLKRSVFETAGAFDEELTHLEDYDFWIRLSLNFRVESINEALVRYYFHGDQMSTRGRENLVGRDAVIKKHQEIFNKHRNVLYKHLRRQLRKSILLGEYSLFYKYLFNCIKIRPFSSDLYVHLFASLFLRKFHKELVVKYGPKAKNDFLIY